MRCRAGFLGLCNFNLLAATYQPTWPHNPEHHNMNRNLHENSTLMSPTLFFKVTIKFDKNITVFWDVTPCSLVAVYLRLRETYGFHHQGRSIPNHPSIIRRPPSLFILIMKAVGTSKSSVFSQPIQRSISEDNKFYSHRCKDDTPLTGVEQMYTILTQTHGCKSKWKFTLFLSFIFKLRFKENVNKRGYTLHSTTKVLKGITLFLKIPFIQRFTKEEPL
jgi:hypothetical protein